MFALLIIGVAIAIEYFIAKEFQYIAAEKGYTQSKYFWWCFLMTFVGYAMVLALPDRGGNRAVVAPDELPDL